MGATRWVGGVGGGQGTSATHLPVPHGTTTEHMRPSRRNRHKKGCMSSHMTHRFPESVQATAVRDGDDLAAPRAEDHSRQPTAVHGDPSTLLISA
jgi:hypothetical protein